MYSILLFFKDIYGECDKEYCYDSYQFWLINISEILTYKIQNNTINISEKYFLLTEKILNDESFYLDKKTSTVSKIFYNLKIGNFIYLFDRFWKSQCLYSLIFLPILFFLLILFRK